MTKIKKVIELKPNELGTKLKDILIAKVADEIEDSCDESIGCIIAIDSYKNFSSGKIQYGTGKVIFEVNLNCMVCKPEVGEVLDVIVSEVKETVILATAGPIIVAILKKDFGEQKQHSPHTKEGIRTFVSETTKSGISPGSEIRIRILSLRKSTVEEREIIFCVGS